MTCLSSVPSWLQEWLPKSKVAPADKEAMGQLLIIQDDGKIGALLDADHSLVRAAGSEDLRRILSSQRFDAALVSNYGAAELTLPVLRELDGDLAVIVATEHAAQKVPEDAAWEILPAPLLPQTLRPAVRRAMQRTELAREVRSLRSLGTAGELGTNPSPADTTGAGSKHLEWIATLPPRLDLRELLASVEKGVIQRTLEATRGAQAEAARRLGLSRSDLSYKLAKYELRKSAGARMKLTEAASSVTSD